MDVGQVAKLERHLSLLRQEYVKLQNKLVDLEQKYSVAVAASGQTGEHENTFVSRLLKTVAELFDKDLYRCKGLSSIIPTVLLYLKLRIVRDFLKKSHSAVKQVRLYLANCGMGLNIKN